MFRTVWKHSLTKNTLVLSVIFNNNINTCRCFTTSSPHQKLNDYNTHLKGKHMKKLIHKKGAKNKKKWYQPHIADPLEPLGNFSKPHKKNVSNSQQTRARQLSHVLYDKITEIISSGELSEEILNKHVFISSVKMNVHFDGMNVYWDADRADYQEVEQLLFAHSGKLRSLLMSYHVLGRIPPVTFVKSNNTFNTALLTELFEKADYGPDYIPHGPTSRKLDTDFNSLDSSNLHSDSSHAGSPLTESPPYSHIFFKPAAEKLGYNTTFDKTSAYFKSQGLFFHTSIYALPHRDLMRKILAKKSPVTKVNEKELNLNIQTVEDYNNRLAKMIASRQMVDKYQQSKKYKQRQIEMNVEEIP